jgi:hypothetical protein
MAAASSAVLRACAALVRAQIEAHAPPLHAALERAFARDVTPFGWTHRATLQDLGIPSRSWPSTSHIPSPIAIVDSTTYDSGRPTEGAIADFAARGGTMLVETDALARVAAVLDAKTEHIGVPGPEKWLVDVELPGASWFGSKLGAVSPGRIDALAGETEVLARAPHSRSPLVTRSRIGGVTIVAFGFSMSPRAPEIEETEPRLTIAELAADLGLAPPASSSDERTPRATLVAAYTPMAILAWTIATALTPPDAPR